MDTTKNKGGHEKILSKFADEEEMCIRDSKNTILIMTSNIGSQYLLDGMDENGNISQESQNAVMEDLRAHFRPEFLNRLDETIMFKPLTKDNIYDIIDLLVADVNKRLADREISIFLTEDAKKYVVDGGYDPNYGARPLKRFLQKHVDTLAAKLMLQGDVGAQDTICLLYTSCGEVRQED